MSITSEQKTWILVGILVIIGGAALVYFDPLGLHLLGPAQTVTVVKPAPPRAAAPAAKPAAAKPTPAPVAAVAPAQAVAPAPVTAAEPAPKPKVAAQPKANIPGGAMSVKPAAAPVAASPAVTPAAAPGLVLQPALQAPKMTGTASASPVAKPERPKNLDLRHCLDLKTDAEIAKCAGE